MKQFLSIIGVTLLALGQPGVSFGHGFGRAGGGYAAAGARGGYASGGYRGGYASGAAGGYAAGARGGSYTGPAGGSVQAGRVGGVGVGPYGGARAGGAEAVRVTTPGGRSYTAGEAGGVRVGPGGGASAYGQRGAVASGPGGTIGGSERGGVALGPYGGAVGGVQRGGFATSAGGAVAAGTRGGVALGPYGGGVAGGGVVAAGRGGVAAGGVAAGRGAYVGHSSYYLSPATLGSRASYVRSVNYGCFTRGWYAGHPVAWRPYGWVGGGYWFAPSWDVVAPYCGLVSDEPPYNYDYGTNVVINDDQVYSNGNLLASAPVYATQAISLADQGRAATPAETETFQALGVFGMIQGEEKEAQHIFQLGVNAAGVVRGNYYNALTDQTTQLYGSVDKKSQRVAWSVGDKKDIVFEAGLYNLTEKQCTALVHYGKEKTIQMIMVRLDEQQDNK